MPGILETIPDVSTLVISIDGNASDDIGALLEKTNALINGDADSPLGTVFSTFNGLETALDIDVSGLAEDLPNTLQALQNVLPANTLQFIESADEAYGTARDFLRDSDLVQTVQSGGGSLQDVALAVVDDALNLFSTRLNGLAGNVIDPAVLATLEAAATSIQEFRDDFPTNQANFLPFVTDYLLGVEPDLLDIPRAHVDMVLSVFDPIAPGNIAATFDPLLQVIFEAYRNLLTTIQTLDPADAAVYVTLQAQLDALETAAAPLFTALNALYQQMATAIANHAWDTIFNGYEAILDAIAIEDVSTLDDIIDVMVEALEDIVARLMSLTNIDILRERLEAFNQGIREASLASPLAEIQNAIQDALADVQQVIEDVPTEVIQEQVLGALQTVTEEINKLGISDIQTQIVDAFAYAESFITTNINDNLKTAIETQFQTFTDSFNPVSVTNLIDELTNAIAQLQTVINNIENIVAGEIDGLQNLVKSFEQLSFNPVSDAVIAEIDELKQRLSQINPNALSGAEKVALQGALAIFDAIDLDAIITNQLKAGYHAAEAEVLKLCDQIRAALQRVKDRFLQYSPAAILSPINDLLDEVAALIEKLNAQILLQVLYEQVDALTSHLESIAPGQILQPLQQPYHTVHTTIDKLNADVLVTPLEALYAEINGYIDIIDITPLLGELENRQRALFNEARTTLINSFTNLSLPSPLDTFFAEIQPLIELVTDALFADPNTELRQINTEFRTRTDLSMLFRPLDDIYLEFVNLLQAIPPNDLTTTMNFIREGIGIGMKVINPQLMLEQLRQGYNQLVVLAPQRLLGSAASLPSLKVSFEANAASAPAERQADVLAVSARFDAVIDITSPTVPSNQMTQLQQSHGALITEALARINRLETSTAQASYAQLANSLDKLLPAFLKQSNPLTHADIIAGVSALRPTTQAARFENVLNVALREFEPLETALETTINDFLLAIRELMQLINPLAIRSGVAGIYSTLREKIEIIDPDALRATIEGIFAPVQNLLDTINPANIEALINTTYNNIVNALTGTVREVLDDLVAIINAKLRAIKASLQTLLQTVRDTITQGVQGLDDIVTQLSNLIFVEFVDRICMAITNLGVSFDKELDRVANAFDEMLYAIPLGGSGSASESVSI